MDKLCGNCRHLQKIDEERGRCAVLVRLVRTYNHCPKFAPTATVSKIERHPTDANGSPVEP
jgi:hypothetical protein